MPRPAPKTATAESPAPKKTNWALIISLTGLLMGSGLIWKVTDLIQQRHAPAFAVTLLNDPAGRKEYEITAALIQYGPPPNGKIDMGVEVRPTYAGAALGRVQVTVKDAKGRTVGTGEWPSFDKSSQPLQVKLDWAALAPILANQGPSFDAAAEYGATVSPFTVEIVDSTGKVLSTDAFKINQTPWYHFTHTSPNFLYQNYQTIGIFIWGRNLGVASQFELLTEVYGMTDPQKSGPAVGKPFAPWPKLFTATTDMGRVEAQADFKTSLQIASDKFAFQPGNCYALKTYVLKKLPYVDFQGVAWTDAPEAWRLGDSEDYSLVCYPAQ
jgi:hypothetical protein